MTEPTGKFAFLNRKDAIVFLRLMFVELRKLTLRDGFFGVQVALDNAIKELKMVEGRAERSGVAPIPEKQKPLE
jgi:hypothetical protein